MSKFQKLIDEVLPALTLIGAPVSLFSITLVNILGYFMELNYSSIIITTICIAILWITTLLWLYIYIKSRK